MPLVSTTLGMFIIDVFDFPPDRPQVEDQIGGGGTYVTVAARMFLEPEKVGMIVDRGRDWQSKWQDHLDTFGPCWIYRDDRSRLTTKARATYNGETRGFEYLTPRKRLSPRDLAPTRMAAPEYLHFVCAPTRALEIIAEIDELGWAESTKLVYEPIPDLCIPSEMPSLRKVLPRIHYFSPNHEEAGTFFGLQVESDTALAGDAKDADEKVRIIEDLAQRFLDEGARDNVIIRSGKLGAFAKRRRGNSTESHGIWLPPYHTSPAKVVDVTGAGNAFLGGMMAGLHLSSGDLTSACIYGAVASSYIIEQYGLPTVDSAGRWNGSDVPSDRVAELRGRLSL